MNYLINISEVERRVQYYLEQHGLPEDFLAEISKVPCSLQIEKNLHVIKVFDRLIKAFILLARCYKEKNRIVEAIFISLRQSNPTTTWTVENICGVLSSIMSYMLVPGNSISIINNAPSETEEEANMIFIIATPTNNITPMGEA